jgi:nicotinate-nucleotide adenylyltransferase
MNSISTHNNQSIRNLDNCDVCLYVGSFDPPHIGHQTMVNHLLNLCCFDYIMLVPTYQHCFKDNVSNFDHRINMLTLAFRHMTNVLISPVERELLENEKNLTHQTISHLRKLYPKTRFSLSMGSDLFNGFSKWVNVESYNDVIVHVIVRQGYPIDIENMNIVKEVYGVKVNIVNEGNPIKNVSSSNIKEKIKANESLCGFMSLGIIQYVKDELNSYL